MNLSLNGWLTEIMMRYVQHAVPRRTATPRQAISRGFAFDVICRLHADFPRASASNPTFFFHGGPSPRGSPYPPSLAPPASSPPKGGGEAGLAAPLRVLELRHVGEGGVDCRYADARGVAAYGRRALRLPVPAREPRAQSHEVCLDIGGWCELC